MAASAVHAERGYRYDQECPPARELIRQQMVEIIAAERGITAGRSTSNTPRLKRRMEISNVPPPGHKRRSRLPDRNPARRR